MLVKEKISVSRPIRLGIIGGGQLGKMIAAEAKRMFMDVTILDPNEKCPASYLADRVILGSFSNEEKIIELSKEVDVVTYEIELVNSNALYMLEQEGKIINPSSKILSIIQNKYRQKKFLKENGLDVPDFMIINSEDDLRGYCSKNGFPVMMKACEDAYDGRGNYLIKNESEISIGYQFLSGRECMLEKFVDFKQEISIMIARNTRGEISFFPVVENIHRDHILEITIAPARISQEIETKAIDLAKRTIESLKGIGIFGIEMFVDKNENVLINEIAPRPHNSGHYSIEACSISQFEQHIRSILNYPMPIPYLISRAVMINILGPKTCEGSYEITGLEDIFRIPGVRIHIYGKPETKYNRKLGHITALVIGNDDPLILAEKIKNLIKIQSSG